MFAQHRPKRSVDFFELSVSHAYILNEVFSNLVYMLDESARKQEWIRMAEEKLGVGAFVISDAFIQNVEEGWDREIFSNASLEDWLCNIITADYVLTDSFHGTCLAIIFNKPFITFANSARGKARFDSLKEVFHLDDRIIEPSSILDININLLKESLNINQSKYKDLKDSSINYLKRNLDFF